MINELNKKGGKAYFAAPKYWISPNGEWLGGSHLTTAQNVLGKEFDMVYCYRNMWLKGYIRAVEMDGTLYYQKNPSIVLTSIQSKTMESYCQSRKLTLVEDTI